MERTKEFNDYIQRLTELFQQGIISEEQFNKYLEDYQEEEDARIRLSE
jgi:hypothetical protein